MAIIDERDKPRIQKRLGQMKEPVKLINFTQELECQFCHETRQLLEELSALSDKIELQVYDFVKDEARAEEFRVDKIPATILLDERDLGIRYFGVPAGYEFATLIDDIVMVSKRDSGLSPASRQKVKELSSPAHIQVFVTPT